MMQALNPKIDNDMSLKQAPKTPAALATGVLNNTSPDQGFSLVEYVKSANK